MRIEAEALAAEAAHCPQHVPAVHTYDARMCIIAMQASCACRVPRRRGAAAAPTALQTELAGGQVCRDHPPNAPHRPCDAPQYLAPPHTIVRKGLIEGRVYPRLAAHLAAFLAETLFHTSLLALPSDRFRRVPFAQRAAGGGVGAGRGPACSCPLAPPGSAMAQWQALCQCASQALSARCAHWWVTRHGAPCRCTDARVTCRGVPQRPLCAHACRSNVAQFTNGEMCRLTEQAS